MAVADLLSFMVITLTEAVVRRDALSSAALAATGMVPMPWPLSDRQARREVSLAEAVDLIPRESAALLAACRAADGHMLLRGEGCPGCWIVPVPKADLLLEDTYGSARAAAEFARAADALDAMHALVTPANGHLAISDVSIATRWGAPSSIWPLGELHFCFLRRRREWWPGIDGFESLDALGLALDTSLADALKAGHEVLFTAASGYLAVSSDYEAELRRSLGL